MILLIYNQTKRYIGTDTTIIPPLLLPEEGSLNTSFINLIIINDIFSAITLNFLFFLWSGIWSYDPAVCRSMGISYANEQTNYNDIPVYVYDFDLDSELNAKKCFCRDENTCPPKGTFDMYRCSGVRMNRTINCCWYYHFFFSSFEISWNLSRKF